MPLAGPEVARAREVAPSQVAQPNHHLHKLWPSSQVVAMRLDPSAQPVHQPRWGPTLLQSVSWTDSELPPSQSGMRPAVLPFDVLNEKRT